MDHSLISSFSSSKPLVSLPLSHNLQRPRNLKIISCKFGGEGKETPNYYKVLCLNVEDVSVDQIKKAYRRMALQYHPDVCNPSTREESTRMFVELHKAYKTLSDPILRKNYDYELGFTEFGRTCNDEAREGIFRERRWEEQLCELRRRSDRRMAQRESIF